MFERLNTPQDAYNFTLGAALKMEQKVLDVLESSADEAQDAINARAMGREDVVAVLQRTIESEQQRLEAAKRDPEQVAAVTPRQPA
jgi:ferritin-like metal-binding protein YciE